MISRESLKIMIFLRMITEDYIILWPCKKNWRIFDFIGCGNRFTWQTLSH